MIDREIDLTVEDENKDFFKLVLICFASQWGSGGRLELIRRSVGHKQLFFWSEVFLIDIRG